MILHYIRQKQEGLLEAAATANVVYMNRLLIGQNFQSAIS